jgi:transcriptional regulator with XRE-family HTH domain
MSMLETKNRKAFLTLLKEARIHAGLRQADLAEKLGVPQSMISKYEVGERRLDILEVRKICMALNMPLLKFIQQLEATLGEGDNEAN